MKSQQTVKWVAAAFVAATAIAGIGAGPAAADSSSRPISGSAQGGFAGVTEQGELVFEYTGSCSHLGKFTRREVVTVVGASLSGTIDFTSASGDVLHVTFTGQFDDATHASGTYTFAGGTGRFDDATGTATFQAYAPNFGDVSVTFEGTIGY